MNKCYNERWSIVFVHQHYDVTCKPLIVRQLLGSEILTFQRPQEIHGWFQLLISFAFARALAKNGCSRLLLLLNGYIDHVLLLEVCHQASRRLCRPLINIPQIILLLYTTHFLTHLRVNFDDCYDQFTKCSE